MASRRCQAKYFDVSVSLGNIIDPMLGALVRTGNKVVLAILEDCIPVLVELLGVVRRISVDINACKNIDTRNRRRLWSTTFSQFKPLGL
jgi:hypothetical protein